MCNLVWSKNSQELVSTHEYSSTSGQSQICTWSYPRMDMIATLSGHTHRVLYLAMSQTIVTGAGDETFQIWNAFPRAQERQRGRAVEAGGGPWPGGGSVREIWGCAVVGCGDLIRPLAPLRLDLVFITTRHASTTDSTPTCLERLSLFVQLSFFPDRCVSGYAVHTYCAHSSHELASSVVRDQLSPVYSGAPRRVSCRYCTSGRHNGDSNRLIQMVDQRATLISLL